MGVIILLYIVILINIFEFAKYRRGFNDDFILINNDLILINSGEFEFDDEIKAVKILFIEKGFNNSRSFLIKLSNYLRT